MLKVSVLVAFILFLVWGFGSLVIAIGDGLSHQSHQSQKQSSGAVAKISQISAERDNFGKFEVSGVVVNQTSSTLRDVTITFTLLDDQRNVVGYAIDRIPEIDPYQRWKFRSSAYEKDAEFYQFKHLTVDAFGRAAVTVEFEKQPR